MGYESASRISLVDSISNRLWDGKITPRWYKSLIKSPDKLRQSIKKQMYTLEVKPERPNILPFGNSITKIDPETLKGKDHSRERRIWLDRIWGKAENYLNAGYSFDEIVQFLGIKDPYLIKSVLYSLPRRMDHKTAKAIMDLKNKDGDLTGWRHLYTKTVSEQEQKTEIKMSDKNKLNLAMKLVRMRNSENERIFSISTAPGIDISNGEFVCNPVVASYLLERKALIMAEVNEEKKDNLVRKLARILSGIKNKRMKEADLRIKPAVVQAGD